MKTMKINTKRLFSSLLSLMMVVNMVPPPLAYAAETAGTGLCPHHTGHTSECRYVAPTDGQPCQHEHDDACGYIAAAEEIPCSMGCEDTDGDGVTDHAPDCAYAPAAEEQPCQHVHDEACGYEEANPGQPCGYVCTACAETNTDASAEPDVPATEPDDNISPVQELINALPDAESITSDNADDVKAQLDGIDSAKADLSDEELDTLDTARYDAAVSVLLAIEGMEGANQPQTLEEGHADQQPEDEARVTIGGTTLYYATFTDAWDYACQQTEAKIHLLQSVDLGKNYLTMGSSSHSSITMTMDEEVVLSGSGSYVMLFNNNSTTTEFTLESGTIIKDSTESGTPTICCTRGTVNIKGGSIRNENGTGTSSGIFAQTDATVNISGGSVTGNRGLFVSGSPTVKLSGGTFSGSTYSIISSGTLAGLLADGHEYRQNGKTVAEKDLTKTQLTGEVSVVKTTVEITAQPSKELAVYYGDKTEHVLSLTAELVAPVEGDAITYQWYKALNGSSEPGEAIPDAKAADYTLPADLAVGTYNFYCVVSTEQGPDESAVRSDAAVVRVLKSGTAVSASVSPSTCVYGETITVTAAAQPTGASPAMLTAENTAPASGQMAVYYGNTQVSAPADKNAEGNYVMTVKTGDVAAAARSAGSSIQSGTPITLTAKFVGTDSMADVSFKITPKTISVTGATLFEKRYDGTKEGTVDSVTFEGLVEGDSLESSEYIATAFYNDAAVGEGKTVTGTVTLDEIASRYVLEEGKNTFKLTNQSIGLAKLYADVTLNPARYEYAGPNTPVEPGKDKITVKVEGETIPSDKYEVVNYNYNTQPGKASVAVSGATDNYTFYGEGEFEIYCPHPGTEVDESGETVCTLCKEPVPIRVVYGDPEAPAKTEAYFDFSAALSAALTALNDTENVVDNITLNVLSDEAYDLDVPLMVPTDKTLNLVMETVNHMPLNMPLNAPIIVNGTLNMTKVYVIPCNDTSVEPPEVTVNGTLLLDDAYLDPDTSSMTVGSDATITVQNYGDIEVGSMTVGSGATITVQGGESYIATESLEVTNGTLADLKKKDLLFIGTTNPNEPPHTLSEEELKQSSFTGSLQIIALPFTIEAPEKTEFEETEGYTEPPELTVTVKADSDKMEEIAYQWYDKNDEQVGSGSALIVPTDLDPGTYTYYCAVYEYNSGYSENSAKFTATVNPCEHTPGADGTCTTCHKAFSIKAAYEDGTTAQHTSFYEAFEAFNKSGKSGVTLTITGTEPFYNVDTPVTIAEGKTVSLVAAEGTDPTIKFNDPLTVNGALTLDGTDAGALASITIDKNATVSFNNNSYIDTESLTVTGGTLADLQEKGCALMEEALMGGFGPLSTDKLAKSSYTGYLCMFAIPATISGPDTTEHKLPYGYTADQAPVLSVTVTPNEGVSTNSISYKWIVDGTEYSGETSSTLTVPTGLETGVHTIYCLVTCAGDIPYYMTSETVTVTVGVSTCEHNWDETGECSKCQKTASVTAVYGEAAKPEYYLTLYEALEAFNKSPAGSSATMTLSSDITSINTSVTVPAGKTLSLESASGGLLLGAPVTVEEGGTVELNGLKLADTSGTDLMSGGQSRLCVNGTLILNNTQVESSGIITAGSNAKISFLNGSAIMAAGLNVTGGGTLADLNKNGWAFLKVAGAESRWLTEEEMQLSSYSGMMYIMAPPVTVTSPEQDKYTLTYGYTEDDTAGISVTATPNPNPILPEGKAVCMWYKDGKLITNSDGSPAFPVGLPVGTYKCYCDVNYIMTGPSGGYMIYKAKSKSITVTVEKAPLTIEDAEIAQKIYDGTTTATLTGVTLGGLVNGETLTYGVDYTATAEFTDPAAGTDNKDLRVSIKLEDTPKANHYKAPEEPVVLSGFTIEKAGSAANPVSVDKPQVVYGDSFTVTVSGIGIAAQANILSDTADAALKQGKLYLYNGDKFLCGASVNAEGTGGTLTYNTSGKGLTIGENNLTVKYGGSENLLENPSIGTAKVTLSKAPISIGTVKETYTGANITKTVTELTGVLKGDVVSAAVTTQGKDVGDYSVGEKQLTYSLTGEHSAYYDVNDGTLTITKAPLTIKAATLGEKTFDGTKTATVTGVTFDGVLGEDNLTSGVDYTATAEFTDPSAGTDKTANVTVTLNGTQLANNYEVTQSPVELPGYTIAQAGSTAGPISVDKPQVVYGQPFTVTVSGIGAAAQAATLADTADAVLEKGKLYLYKGATKLCEANVNAEGTGGTLTYDTQGKGLAIGENTLTVKYGGSNDLLENQSLGTVKVTLKKAPLSIGTVTEPYKGDNVTKTVAITDGVKDGDSVSAEVTTTGKDVGSYSIADNKLTASLTGTGTAFYEVTGGTLEITRAC